MKPEQAFYLEGIPAAKRDLVVEELEANDWMPKSRASARQAQQVSRDDGGDSF